MEAGSVRRWLWAFILVTSAGSSNQTAFQTAPGPGFVFQASKTDAKFLIEAMGGGVAMFDADRDGKLDLFFANGAALHAGMKNGAVADKSDRKFWNRLYRNKGDGTFEDITERAGVRGTGYSQGVAAVDCDNDGNTDLFVTGLAGNHLYRNKGGGVFEDVTPIADVAGGGWSTSAGFLDYDRDGNLDLFVARYLDWDFGKNKRCGAEGADMQAYCHPNEFAAVTHLLYRGLGGCRFADVSTKSGIAKAPGKGLGVAFQDADGDGWTDIFVANDSFPQQLFRNNGDGTFEETGLAMGVAYDENGGTFAGMGTDFADYNNDGRPDIFVNALANQGYALFQNRGGKLFEYVSGPSGLAAISKLHSGWGTRFLDYDNDGWKDIFVAQSHVMDNIERTQPTLRYSEKPVLLRNAGGKFTDVSPRAGEPFQVPLIGRGAAFGDLDSDGAVDIALSVLDGAARVFRNNAAPNGNHWLSIQTIGTKSNRDGIGAAITVTTPSGRIQTGFVSTAGSYLSSHDKRVHFGLGEERVATVAIRWPSGTTQTLRNVATDRVLTVTEEVKQ